MVDQSSDDDENEAVVIQRVTMPPEVEAWIGRAMREMPHGAHLVLQSASERESVCVLVPRTGYDVMSGLAELAKQPERLQALLTYEPPHTYSFEQVFNSTTR